MKFIQLFGLIAILAPYCLAASATNSELGQRDEAVSNSQQISSECDNNIKITRIIGDCNPSQSRGIRKSAHDCPGKHYFCFNQKTQRGTCMKIAAARKKNYEHGECFL